MRALCTILCLLFLTPFAALAIQAISSTDPALWPLHAVELKSVLGSLVTGLLAALASTALGAVLAYQVSFHRFPFKGVLERLLVLPVLLPTFVLGAVYKELFCASGILANAFALPTSLTLDLESPSGFVFVMTLGLYPYVYLLGRISFESHGRAFFELGHSVGLSAARAFARIALPFALPALLLGAALVFVETSGEWATASLLSVNTSATTIHELWFTREATGIASQLAFLFVLLALIALLLLSRWTGRQRARFLTALPAYPPQLPGAREPLHLAWMRFAICFLPVLFGFLVPAASVAVFFARTAPAMDLSLLLTNSANTAALLIIVLAICAVFTLVLTLTHRMTSGALTGFAMRWLVVSYTIPGTVLAVGVLILAGRLFSVDQRYDDLTSFVILVCTLSIRFVCFLLLPVYIGLSFVTDQVENTAASLGLSKVQAFFRVHLPLIRRFALLGLLLVVLQILKETSISVALHPFSFQTLVLKTHAYVEINLLPESAAWIVATALLGLYPLLTIERMLTNRSASRS